MVEMDERTVSSLKCVHKVNEGLIDDSGVAARRRAEECNKIGKIWR